MLFMGAPSVLRRRGALYFFKKGRVFLKKRRGMRKRVRLSVNKVRPQRIFGCANVGAAECLMRGSYPCYKKNLYKKPVYLGALIACFKAEKIIERMGVRN